MEPVDVVIVTYNSEHVVADLLDSLPAALAGTPARVLVVDNGSVDGTLQLLESRGDCRVVRAENRGYAAGLNRGVAELSGSGPILVLNPDVRLHPRAVATMVETLTGPGTGIVAPLVLDEDGRPTRSLRREPTLSRALGLGRVGTATMSEYVSDADSYRRPGTVDWALGAVLLMSRAAYDMVGGWDESFFLYSEETDFCLRARDHGLATRFTPDAVATHIGGASGTSAQIHAMQIVNRVRLYRRRNPAALAVLYLLVTVASELSWMLRGHRQSAAAVAALLSPPRRPAQLGLGAHWLPR